MIALVPAFLALLVAGQARATTIVHTNDVMGELEPCGCRSNPQGGIARKANLLSRLPDKSLLQLDAGDLLFPTDTVPGLLAEQSRLQASYLLKAHEQLGQDAVVPGEKDFALGFKAFQELTKKSKIHFLAANLKSKKGKKVFETHAIFTRTEGKHTLRIGVVGLVGTDLAWPHELKASDVIAAAKAEVRALRKKVDLLVALTHQGYEKDVALALAVPSFDMIIGGHTQSFLQKPIKVGSTWIYQSSFRNQYVGVIPLASRDNPETYRLIGLDTGYDSPVESVTKTDELVKEAKSAIAELNTQETARLEARSISQNSNDSGNSSDPHGSKFQTFSRCAECHLKQFDFWRKTRHATAFHVLFEKNQSMNKDCLGCHTVGLGDAKGFQDISRLLEIPVETPAQEGAASSGEKPTFLSHEKTDSFLQAMHEAKSLKSTVKFPVDHADRSEMTLRRAIATVNRAWTPVQCENCHGPGHDHPFGANISKKVENVTCLKCHTEDRAPEWYIGSTGQPDWKKIEAKRALIACPAGELPPEETSE